MSVRIVRRIRHGPPTVRFGGGFPREDDLTCRRAAQRAIYFVQRELEVTGEAHAPAVLRCDRGTLDGLAHWPGRLEDFWESTHTTLAAELARYDLVVHLRTPRARQGYNHQNPLRTESAPAAAQIDERIRAVWEPPPRRVVVEASGDFLDKAVTALGVLRGELPHCCASHLDEAAKEADHRTGPLLVLGVAAPGVAMALSGSDTGLARVPFNGGVCGGGRAQDRLRAGR